MIEGYHHLSNAYRVTTYLLNIPIVNDNSLEQRFRLTLGNKQTSLSQALTLLNENKMNKDRFHTLSFEIYHSDEVGNLLFGAWKRATKWNGLKGKSTVKEMSKYKSQVKRDLQLAIPLLEEILGDDDIKYVVPALYRSKNR
ncbi:hypothetical protein [Halobacillus amylolyticus]|uniref:Uncharacterized protein n=1 Tax=Halobacillus amylolyticus TaxID=2932259 RepID=A0ABY4H869_9BACI|nr:hypothetical protein [Halobacillus amylolyticus]UOR10892.1 hypothetical protein MUO15_14925 [Halobacillus amylolyticus]